MRLKYQLFFLLLLTGALLIALMAAIASWSFSRGFIGYINDTERAQLDPLINALAETYRQERSWQWIEDDRGAWKSMLDTHLGFVGPVKPRGSRDSSPRDTNRIADRGTQSDAAPRRSPERSSKPPGGRRITMDPRLLLADAERHLILGRERDGEVVQWQPIVSEDETVGYLGYRDRTDLPGQLDVAFADQQRRTFVYAAIAMAVLSALLAVALAGRVVRPLLAVNDAVARIGRGEYAHRVPLSRRDELGDLSQSINTLAATLERSQSARRQWFAEISHELRTPVAVLQGELEAMQDGINPLDASAVDSLHAETLRLTRLIEDLHELTLSDLGALDYRFEQVDVADVIEDRAASASHQLNQANMTLRIVPPSPETADVSSSKAQDTGISGDAQRLGQLIDNLLQNSLRYTDAPGQVHVTLTAEADNVVVEWADSAPDVADEQLERLFDPLYRVDASRNRVHAGAGLGLAIAQKIVEAHSGTISAHSSTLGGLAVRVVLPRRPEPSA